MTRLLEILIAMAIVAVLFVLVGIFLPSSRTIVEKVETNRQRTIVFDTLNSMHRFDEWNPVVLHDPKVQLKASGPESGVGARMDYSSEVRSVGNGSWEIAESDEGERVLYRLDGPQRGTNKTMEFQLKTTGRGGRNIEITQRYRVDYGWDLLGRFAGLYVRGSVGEDMKLGMRRLGSMLAGVPNVDYRVEGSTLRGLEVVQKPAENLLTVFAGAVPRSNQDIKDSMRSNSEWIKRTMDANGLEASGPMRIVTTELGRETYTFDVVQPVRKKGSGAAEASEGEAGGNGESAEVADTAAAFGVDDGELTGLELLGPVKYERTEAGEVVRARYTGFMPELANVRNAVRAWAMTRGHEPVGRSYDVYKNGVDPAFTANGEFDVYWNLKQ